MQLANKKKLLIFLLFRSLKHKERSCQAVTDQSQEPQAQSGSPTRLQTKVMLCCLPGCTQTGSGVGSRAGVWSPCPKLLLSCCTRCLFALSLCCWRLVILDLPSASYLKPSRCKNKPQCLHKLPSSFQELENAGEDASVGLLFTYYFQYVLIFSSLTGLLESVLV